MYIYYHLHVILSSTIFCGKNISEFGEKNKLVKGMKIVIPFVTLISEIYGIYIALSSGEVQK